MMKIATPPPSVGHQPSWSQRTRSSCKSPAAAELSSPAAKGMHGIALAAHPDSVQQPAAVPASNAGEIRLDTSQSGASFQPQLQPPARGDAHGSLPDRAPNAMIQPPADAPEQPQQPQPCPGHSAVSPAAAAQQDTSQPGLSQPAVTQPKICQPQAPLPQAEPSVKCANKQVCHYCRNVLVCTHLVARSHLES